MTINTLLGLIITTMIGVIGYMLKSLIAEHHKTRDSFIAMHENLKFTTEEIVNLKKSDELITQRIVDIIERLVRLEERTNTDRHVYGKPARRTSHYKGSS
jgi:hypothetical protein